MIRYYVRAACGLFLSTGLALAQVGQVRHAPSISGTVEGSLQQMPADNWPAVPAVPRPTQKALVKVSNRDQTINWRTVRNLSLSSGVGQIAVPAGTYGNFSAAANSGFTLGTAGAVTPSVYNFQELALNGASKLLVAGPVVINLANGVTASSTVGAPANPAWLTLNIPSGGLTLDRGARFFGQVSAPSGPVIIGNNAQLVGGVTADHLTVHAGGLLRLESPHSGNLPPTVSLTAPASGSNYVPPAAITLSAAATDADGAVTKVEFFQGTRKVGEVTTAPYDFTLPDVAAGSYAFIARATDSAGATTDSAAIDVTVSNSNQAPTALLTAPVDGAVYDAPATIAVAAAANDSDGSVARVDFYQDATLIGSDGTAPFEATASAVAGGSYVFSAVAVDSGGVSTTSTTATVMVVALNLAPTVVITAPADRAKFDDPADFAVTAKAADTDGTVVKVGFFLNGVLLREDLTAPHDAGVAGLVPGTYEILARATDNRGASTDSAPVRVTVAHVNDPPVPVPLSVTTSEESAVAITLAATDAEGDPFTFAVVAPPASGSLAGTAPDLTYTPGLNFSGEDKFTFRVSDSSLAATVATVTITVRPINDPPTAETKSLTVAEGRPGQILLSGTDVDNASLQFAVISGPAHGVLSGSPPVLTYTPTPGYNGPDKFVYAAFDGESISPPAVATITISSENDVPVAIVGAATVDEDGSVAVSLGGTDADGEALTYSVTAAPAHGRLSGTAPNLSYTPDANFHGTDTFTFTVSDGLTASAEATVMVTVRPVNDVPVAQAQAVTTAEDATLLVALAATDGDGDRLTYSVVTPPAHGRLSGTGPSLIYTPADNFQGQDSFAFQASDGAGDSAPATVSITVAPFNDAPSASAFTVDLQEDVPAAFELRARDQDGDALTYLIVIPPQHGALSGSVPNLTYTPAADYFGDDEFAYKVSDGSNESAPVYVTLRVAPVNDAPVGANLTVTLAENTTAGFELSGTDEDSEELTFAIVDAPAHGGLSVLEPRLFYTPVANFNGTDTLTYTVGDGSLLSAVCTVTFAVTPMNDAPVADPKALTTDEDVPVSVTLSGSDPDGDSLAYAIVTPPGHGLLREESPGTYVYTPALNFIGNDSFAYAAKDAAASSAPVPVSITVVPVNDAPEAVAQSVVTAEDTVVEITLAAADLEGDALTYAILAKPTHGTLTQVSANAYAYQPAPDYNGPDRFEFVAKDQALQSAPAVVTLEVRAGNDPPEPANQTPATDEDVPVIITLSGTDSDGDALTCTVAIAPAHGTLSGTAPNLIYTPDANYHGMDLFTFTVSDSTATSVPATVVVTINPVNDAPVAAAQSVVTSGNTAVEITLAGSDVDGDLLTFAVSANPTHGTLTAVSANTYSYQPARDYHGPDAFGFVAKDQALRSAPAVVALAVTPVEEAPVATEEKVAAGEPQSPGRCFAIPFSIQANQKQAGPDLRPSPRLWTAGRAGRKYVRCSTGRPELGPYLSAGEFIFACEII